MTGWGLHSNESEPTEDDLTEANGLMTANVTGAALKECRDHGLAEISEEMHLCAWSNEQDACQGDSGGKWSKIAFMLKGQKAN